jgi:hypothetical protein
MSGTITVTGMSAGLTSGYKVIGPITITGSNPVGEIIDATLASGDNTFTVPTGATAVLLALGSASAVTVKVRTNLNAGDAGLPVAPFGGVGFMVFNLVADVTSVILNASGSLPNAELSFI